MRKGIIATAYQCSPEIDHVETLTDTKITRSSARAHAPSQTHVTKPKLNNSEPQEPIAPEVAPH